jgi:hypothetical protein
MATKCSSIGVLFSPQPTVDGHHFSRIGPGVLQHAWSRYPIAGVDLSDRVWVLVLLIATWCDVQTPIFNPKKIGVAALVISCGMFVTEMAWRPIFSLDIGGFLFPVYILLLIYGGLQLYVWRSTVEQLPLTDDEVKRWGDKLEKATPLIVDQLNEQRAVKEIAIEVKEKYGIPEVTTLRYIIPLVRHIRSNHAASSEPSAD